MPVTPRIGANVEGISLAEPLTNRQVDDLRRALAEHQVLFFRDQPLDEESHKRLGRYFGDLHIHPNTPGPAGHPEILPIHADANSKRVNGEFWHSDVFSTFTRFRARAAIRSLPANTRPIMRFRCA
jgi:taurine dioxygenase